MTHGSVTIIEECGTQDCSGAGVLKNTKSAKNESPADPACLKYFQILTLWNPPVDDKLNPQSIKRKVAN